MLQKKLMSLGIALSVISVSFSQVNLKTTAVSIEQGLSNPYGNVSASKGETLMKKRFEGDENMSQDKLNTLLIHWQSIAPMWINLNISNGPNFDIPPGTPSYSSGIIYNMTEGYYDFTFTPYGSPNGYQDYAVGCEETAANKPEQWTIYNVHITEECSDIYIGHGN